MFVDWSNSNASSQPLIQQILADTQTKQKLEKDIANDAEACQAIGQYVCNVNGMRSKIGDRRYTWRWVLQGDPKTSGTVSVNSITSP